MTAKDAVGKATTAITATTNHPETDDTYMDQSTNEYVR
eukprot:CAMPEP_0170958806 /NCGR_PEP_ID=MMETSP0735-20130129/35921_1 /TAXON_ID=186038 /ORGANISM="Fragilariopsis kerguelensis, Strain L26-C5" /LENGTH=37 /DNA_ID= /DNA_START= /DNA_END= /DNA_ORIENTATION=